MSQPTQSPMRLETLHATAARQIRISESSLVVEALTDAHEAEVLSFLAERPLFTVVMSGHIRDNGLENSLNRGSFHACRNGEGALEGVALIGHATLLETRSEAALAAFARLAQASPAAHMIMGEQEKIERFWRYYARDGQAPRRVCRELLMEQQWPVEALEPVAQLRLATMSDVESVMRVQAEMAYAESGINPLYVDPSGFFMRCARRIEQGRVWVWTEDDRLVFKADVISDTPQATYLEGIYINPSDRNKGYGARCMSHLGQTLLQRSGSIAILVNEQSVRAVAFFERIGFKLRSNYDTIFLEQGAKDSESLVAS